MEKLLVVNDQYELKGLITVKDIQKKLKYPNACKDDQGRLRVGGPLARPAITLNAPPSWCEARADVLAIDSAHGHSSRVLEAVREVKKRFPDVDLLAGNVATYDGAMALIEAGADAVKVGIGPGSICTTRMVTGAGMPQITPSAEAFRAGREHGIPVIADGGIKYSGRCDQGHCSGRKRRDDRLALRGRRREPRRDDSLPGAQSSRAYRGMGSLTRDERKVRANDISRAHGFPRRSQRVPKVWCQREQSGQNRLAKYVPEGIEGRVPYRGPLEAMVFQLVGGLRSGMGYLGCGTIEELQDPVALRAHLRRRPAREPRSRRDHHPRSAELPCRVGLAAQAHAASPHSQPATGASARLRRITFRRFRQSSFRPINSHGISGERCRRTESLDGWMRSAGATRYSNGG